MNGSLPLPHYKKKIQNKKQKKVGDNWMSHRPTLGENLEIAS